MTMTMRMRMMRSWPGSDEVFHLCRQPLWPGAGTWVNISCHHHHSWLSSCLSSSSSLSSTSSSSPCDSWMFLMLWLAQVSGMLRVASTLSIPLCRFKPLEKNFTLFTSVNGDGFCKSGGNLPRMLLMTGTLNYCAGFLLRGRSQEHGPCCSGLVEPGWRHDHGVSGVRTKRSLGIEGLMVMVMVVLMMMRRGRRGWRRAEEGRGRGEDDWGWPGVLHSCWRWFAGSPVDHMKDLKISWSL